MEKRKRTKIYILFFVAFSAGTAYFLILNNILFKARVSTIDVEGEFFAEKTLPHNTTTLMINILSGSSNPPDKVQVIIYVPELDVMEVINLTNNGCPGFTSGCYSFTNKEIFTPPFPHFRLSLPSSILINYSIAIYPSSSTKYRIQTILNYDLNRESAMITPIISLLISCIFFTIGIFMLGESRERGILVKKLFLEGISKKLRIVFLIISFILTFFNTFNCIFQYSLNSLS